MRVTNYSPLPVADRMGRRTVAYFVYRHSDGKQFETFYTSRGRGLATCRRLAEITAQRRDASERGAA